MQKVPFFNQFGVLLAASQPQSNDLLKGIEKSVGVTELKMQALYI